MTMLYCTVYCTAYCAAKRLLSKPEYNTLTLYRNPGDARVRPDCAQLDLQPRARDLRSAQNHEHVICAQLRITSTRSALSSESYVAAAAAARPVNSSPSALARMKVGQGRAGQGRGGLLFPHEFFSKADLHVHVPARGVPKDGPSAGVAIACALLSLLLGWAIDTAVAMTGEVR